MSKITELATAMHKVYREAIVSEPSSQKKPNIVAYVEIDFYHEMRAEIPASGEVSSTLYEFGNFGTISGFPVFEVLPRRNHMSGELERAKPYVIAIVGWREL